MDWMGYGATRAAYPRRKASGYYETIFVGRGIDIGCGDCRATPDCDTWEELHGQGNATLMEGVAPESYDWVYSSHLLEHLEEPATAIQRWWELVKPGGHLLVVVPDEDLFEQGKFPNDYAKGHRWTFTIHKKKSWSPVSISLKTWWKKVLPDAELAWLTRFDTNWVPEAVKQMRCSVDVEAHIELCLRKPLPGEKLVVTPKPVSQAATRQSAPKTEMPAQPAPEVKPHEARVPHRRR